MHVIQYDLFKPIPSELEVLQMQLDEVEKSHHKVRKGTYASINELRKIILEMKEDVDLIKKHICKKEVDKIDKN